LHEVGFTRSNVQIKNSTDEDEVDWDTFVIPFIIKHLNSSIVLNVFKFAKESNSHELAAASVQYLIKENFKSILYSPELNDRFLSISHFGELYDLLISDEFFNKTVKFADIVSLVTNYFSQMNDAIAFLLKINYDLVDPEDAAIIMPYDDPKLNSIKFRLLYTQIQQLREENRRFHKFMESSGKPKA